MFDMTFDELTKEGEKYFKKIRPISPEWVKNALNALKNGEDIDKVFSTPDEINYNVDCCNGCDILNAFNAGYWLAREELHLPKCDKKQPKND